LGSDTLTAYLLSIASEAGWEIPTGSLSRMRGALRNFVAGRAGRDSQSASARPTGREN